MIVKINGRNLTINQVIKVACGKAKVELENSARKRIENSRDILEKIIRESTEPIYGITTGFGNLVSERIPQGKRCMLQENLIKSHSAGVGNPLSEEIVRAAMVLRVNSLARGNSGIRLKVIETLIEMLNKEVHPYVPEKGSLGASGDLAPLAHIAAVLLGCGRAYFEGELLPGQEAMNRAELGTISLREKEGLALINGTQAMSALLCLAYHNATRLSKLADIIGALSTCVLNGNLAQFDKRLHEVRPHPGQLRVAENMRRLTEYHPDEYTPKNIQDAYSLRCIPQVHGAVRLALDHVIEVLTTEINSVTDNPLIFPNSGVVLSGGNFHGEPLALVADYLKIALADLGNISERRINRLLHPHLNGKLPPFLAMDPGLNSGYMLAHYTAASLCSENKTLASPSSVDNIPVSGDQEDHVSMGMNATLNLRKLLENLKYILAVELLCGCQAQEFKNQPLPFALETVYQVVREEITVLEEDEEIYKHMKAAFEMLNGDSLIHAAEQAIGELK